MTDKNCEICKGTGWVCENHTDTPWGEGEGECDCGAGSPCTCNPTGEVDWLYVYASVDPDEKSRSN
jgi:hypothetical protein